MGPGWKGGHLRFKQAQPSMFHFSKVNDVVENKFFFFLNLFLNQILKKNTAICPEPDYQLSVDIHSHKVGTKYPHELPLYLV